MQIEDTWWDKTYSKLLKLSKNKLVSMAKQLRIKDIYESWVLKDDVAYAIALYLEDKKNRNEIIIKLIRGI